MYQYGVLGGTFDHLHAGHEALLRFAFTQCQHIAIGLTTTVMQRDKKLNSLIQSYAIRKKTLISLLAGMNIVKERYSIIPIRTPYGTTLTNPSFEVLFATSQTKKGAEQVNDARRKKGLRPLDIRYCDLIQDSYGTHISSTNIRAGSIRRDGVRYASYLRHDLRLSETSLQQLKKPLGKVYKTIPEFSTLSQIVLIGDIVTQKWVKYRKQFSLAYVDMQSERKRVMWQVQTPYVMDHLHETNVPGTISSTIVRDMHKRLKNNTSNMIVVIHGEEDLLVLPVILLLPLQSIVCYGNPYGNKGVVVVRVTEAMKAQVLLLLTS